MPLRDHYHPPLARQMSWATFHRVWVVALVKQLASKLPRPRYQVECVAHIGPSVANQVAEFEDRAVPLAVQPWTAPVARQTLLANYPDDIEVQVHDTREGLTLVAVIELVSPANKDRQSHRELFVAKCAACLQRGIGVIVADIVTSRLANLHNELVAFLGGTADNQLPDTSTYVVAYRPAVREERGELDLWPVPLALGNTLPTLPLALRREGYVLVDFEAAYNDALGMANLA